MTEYLMKVIANPLTFELLHYDLFLASADIEADDGRGRLEFTRSPRFALRFASPLEAMALWKAQSKTHPLRADGRPNRPVSALSVEITQAPPQ